MGSPGIVLVPAILFHFFQLLSCSFITVRWTPKEGEEEEEEEEIEEIKEMEMKESEHIEPKIEEKHPDVQVEMTVPSATGTNVTNDCY